MISIIDNIVVTWTPFIDLTLENHQIFLHQTSDCSDVAVFSGWTGSHDAEDKGIIDNLANGKYWGKVMAQDRMLPYETTSDCSNDSIIIDTINPLDITGEATTNLVFTNDYNNTGNDIDVTWTAFTDTNLTNHKLFTYTDSACTNQVGDHALTGNNNNFNALVIDGLDDTVNDGKHYGKVRAIDIAGNFVDSACSSDFIIIDRTIPADPGVFVFFTNDEDIDGDDIAVTWSAFTDLNHIAACFNYVGSCKTEIFCFYSRFFHHFARFFNRVYSP